MIEYIVVGSGKHPESDKDQLIVWNGDAESFEDAKQKAWQWALDKGFIEATIFLGSVYEMDAFRKLIRAE